MFAFDLFSFFVDEDHAEISVFDFMFDTCMFSVFAFCIMEEGIVVEVFGLKLGFQL